MEFQVSWKWLNQAIFDRSHKITFVTFPGLHRSTADKTPPDRPAPLAGWFRNITALEG
jgi:hypothetical protein